MTVAVGSIMVAMFCLPKRTNLQAEAICSLLLLCFSNARPKFFKSEYPVVCLSHSLLVTNRIHGQQKSFLSNLLPTSQSYFPYHELVNAIFGLPVDTKVLLRSGQGLCNCLI
jgi:hypothetical protein